MALDVGGIRTRLGFTLEDREADAYERRVRKLRADSHDDVETRLKTDADLTGADRYERRIRDIDRGHQDLIRGSGRVRGALGGLFIGGAGVAAAGVAVTGLVRGVGALNSAYEESYKVGKQTEAALKSTGGVANVTAKEIGALADATSRKTGIDDEAIQTAENLMLTFTNVRNEAGKGNDVFNQATKIMVDMGAALGTDASGSAIQLGKALNDPIKGITALTRVGVSFTDQQKEQITTLVESGRTVDAQKIILKELNKEFGGSAAAQATATDRMRVALGNLAEFLGGKLAPYVSKAAAFIERLVTSFTDGDAASSGFARTVKTVARVIGDVVSAVADGVGAFVHFVRTNDDVQRIVGQVGKTLKVLGETIGDVVGHVIGAVRRMAPDFKTIAEVVLGVMRRIGEYVAPIARIVIPAIGKAIKAVADVIGGVVKIIAGILSGDWSRVWQGFKDVVGGAVDAVVDLAKGGFGVLKKVVGGVIDFVLGAVTTVLDVVEDVVDAGSHLPIVGGKFDDLAKKLDSAKNSIDDYRESLRDTNDEHKRTKTEVEKLGDRVDTARKRYKDAKNELDKYERGTEGYRKAAARARRAQDDLTDATRDQRQAMRQALKPVGELAGNVFALGELVANVADSVGGNINDVLTSLGAKALRYTIKHPKKAGGVAGNLVSNIGSLFATGGIPNPGSGTRDDHLLIAPDGQPVAALSGTEGILNDPQMRHVDTALRFAHAQGMPTYDGLDALWASGLRHHDVGGIIGRAARLDAMHLPYVWGGHHGDALITDPRPGLDCSSAVSYVLNIPPRVSGAFEGFGQPGRGPVTIYANPEHVFMSILGRGFGTSNENPGGGPGWLSYNSRSGFVVRHVDGDFAGLDVTAPTIAGPAGPFKTIGQRAGAVLAKAGTAAITRALSAFDDPSGQPLLEPGAGGSGGNVALGRRMAAARGWTGTLWNALYRLWNRESGWDENARNSSSGAAGIPQDITGNMHGGAQGQIAWGLNYIAGRYGNPANALAHSDQYGWYAEGGKLTAKQKKRRKLEHGLNVQHRGEARAQRGRVITAGERRAAARLAHRTGIAGFDQTISDLETTYGQRERFYGMSEEELIIENDDGSTTVDTAAVKKRGDELLALFRLRQRIRKTIEDYQRAIARMIAAYRRAIARLSNALDHARGRGRGDEREGYRSLIRDYKGRIGELKQTGHDLGIDLKDNRLDLLELGNEYAAVVGTTGTAADAGGDVGGDFTGDAAGGPESSDLADAQAVAAQAGARADALAADLDATRQNLAAFTGSGDIGAGGANAWQAGTDAGPLGAGGGYQGRPAALAAAGGPGGGPTVIVEYHGFTPPTGRQLVEMGQGVAAALGAVPYSPSVGEKVG